jgi:small-conductance mechanosensitive channel
MFTRRVAFMIRVRYGTTPEQLAAIPGMVKEIVDGQEENATFERAHLRNLGQWAAEFEVVYWIKTSDYIVFMDTNQAVLLGVLRALAERGIDIAFPTQMNVRPAEVYSGQAPPLHWPVSDHKGAGA